MNSPTSTASPTPSPISFLAHKINLHPPVAPRLTTNPPPLAPPPKPPSVRISPQPGHSSRPPSPQNSTISSSIWPLAIITASTHLFLGFAPHVAISPANYTPSRLTCSAHC